MTTLQYNYPLIIEKLEKRAKVTKSLLSSLRGKLKRRDILIKKQSEILIKLDELVGLSAQKPSETKAAYEAINEAYDQGFNDAESMIIILYRDLYNVDDRIHFKAYQKQIDEHKLGVWLERQKVAYKMGLLTKCQIDKLKELPFFSFD